MDSQERLASRWGIQINIGKVFKQVVETGVSYSTVYDMLIRDILGIRDKGLRHQWCDKLVLNWDLAETFLDLFPNGVVVHLIRKSASTLKSYQKMTSEPQPIYLDAVFQLLFVIYFCRENSQKAKPKAYYLQITRSC